MTDEERPTCVVCTKQLPPDRKYVGYHKECAGRAPKKKYVIAGFGTKGNGAHVTEFTHGHT